jgi:transcriptional regulator with XRE-family HTH domain
MLSSEIASRLPERRITGVSVVTLVTRLGDTLSKLRTNAGLSRKALGELAGISPGTIKLIEYGDTENPEPETLVRLANGLATNRALNRVDAQTATDVYTLLMTAAGYSLPPQAPISGQSAPLPRKRTRAEARVVFERVYSTSDEKAQALIDALLDHLGERS